MLLAPAPAAQSYSILAYQAVIDNYWKGCRIMTIKYNSGSRGYYPGTLQKGACTTPKKKEKTGKQIAGMPAMQLHVKRSGLLNYIRATTKAFYSLYVMKNWVNRRCSFLPATAADFVAHVYGNAGKGSTPTGHKGQQLWLHAHSGKRSAQQHSKPHPLGAPGQ